MKRLDRQAFDRAAKFLKTQARPLEKTLFAHHFESGSTRQVSQELAHFQNQDGGFGHALEPDMRTPSSSALATGFALDILQEIGAPAADPLVRPAIAYLQETLDPVSQVWRVIPADANHHPHAPWWHDEDGSLARTFGDFQIIPRIQLVSALNYYAQLVPTEWLADITEVAVAAVESTPVLGSGGGSDLQYALGLVQVKTLPQPFKKRLLARIRSAVPAVVSRDPAEWSTYCINPLSIVQSPQSVVYDLIKDDVQRNLDYLIENQTAAGTWDPVWSWGGLYPQHWEQAKLEWRGHITLNNLLALRAFERIEP